MHCLVWLLLLDITSWLCTLVQQIEVASVCPLSRYRRSHVSVAIVLLVNISSV